MRNLLIVLFIIVIALFAINYSLSEKSTVKNQPELVQTIQEDISLENGTYTVLEDANLGWKGYRPLMQGYVDSGIVDIKEGYLEVLDNTIVSGHFIFDMNTIAVQSTGRGQGESMLTNHLKSDDFFSVETYPTSELEITSIENRILLGKLTIKGITQDISFPVHMSTSSDTGNSLRLVGTADLDRTLWNIKYGSGKFFDNLADNVIDDMFTIQVDITLINI